ncbi:MAG: type IV pilus assembly protein PilM [Pseudomonadota bacterium]
MNLFPKKDIIGIDIGSSSVKILELQKARNSYKLKNMGISFLPPGAIVDGAVREKDPVINTIKNLVSNLGIKTKNAAISLSGHSVIVKNISLPVMTEQELEDTIIWEAEQHIPFEVDDVNIDFQILGKPTEDKNQMDVLLVAAKKDIINGYIAVIKEAGLNPVVMDIDPFALGNMFEINYPYNEDEVIALIDIGASILNMNIIKNGIPVFTRAISIGGNKITAEIQKRKDISYEEAETLKLGGKVKDIEFHDLEDIITEISLSLVTEIQRSMDFFWATFTDEAISKIYLSGGCSKSIELKRLLEDRITDIPIEIANPFAGINYNEKALDSEYLEYIAPMMAVGVGLALRQVGDK